MATVVNLDPDIEALLRQEVRNRNVGFDRVLNEAVRAGLAAGNTATAKRPRFVQKTFSMGRPLVDLTKALALADELEDAERIRKMRMAEAGDCA